MTEKNGQNSGKHAYLIIAHGNLRVLELLLRMLDDPRNDIWLHVDRKAQDFDPEKTREIGRRAHDTIPVPWEKVLETAVERYERLVALGKEGKLKDKRKRLL